jgi:cell wall-associated NlpC family hydrolase
MTMRFPALVLLAGLTAAAVGCASTGAVPRPFPGAQPGGQPATPAEPPPPVASRPTPPEVAKAPAVASPPPAPAADLETPGALALATALDLRGVRYRLGGSDPSGFDCSGLVQYVFARQGIALPRDVRRQFGVGYEIATAEVRPGDLLFFNTESDGASHVGIALDGQSFVHAPNSRGVVRVERLSSSYWSQRLLGARRIE